MNNQIPSEEDENRAVFYDSSLIRLVPHPSEETMLIAVKKNGMLIGLLRNPTDNVVRAAIMQNSSAIRLLHSNIREDILIDAIRVDGWAILHISNYTPYMYDLSYAVLERKHPSYTYPNWHKLRKRAYTKSYRDIEKFNNDVLLNEQRDENWEDELNEISHRIDIMREELLLTNNEITRMLIDNMISASTVINYHFFPSEMILTFLQYIMPDLKDVVVVIRKSVFDNMPVIKIAKDSYCTICQNIIAQGENIKDLKCKHDFHSDCLCQLLCEYSVKCPVCRTDLTLCDDDKDYI